MNLDRRRFCRATTGALAATILPLVARAAPVPSNDGFTIIEAAPGALRLVPAPAPETAVWCYGGSVPGPIIRIKKGDELKVRLVNKLPQPTTISWHGVRIVNAMDGVAGLTQAPVLPDATFEYCFTPPDAGLYWYHPHVFPHSAEQTGRGLYGVLIVDETDPPKVDHDLLVVLDDWSLDARAQIEGSFRDPALAKGPGRIGSLVTANSKPVPETFTVRPGARIRLRVLNACSARVALIGFDRAPPTVIALDGQPSEMFRPARDTVPLGPGSRVEVMLDMPAATGQVQVVLRGLGTPDHPLMILKVEGAPGAAHPPIAKLPDNSLLPTRIHLERSLKLDLAIAASSSSPGKSTSGASQWFWSLGGVASDGASGKPLFSVRRGSP